MAAEQVCVVEPVFFPAGVADREAAAAYVADSGAIIAVDLDDGHVAWRTDQARRPLIVVGEHLVAVRASEDSPKELRVVVLDVARQGEPILTSAPVVFPEWLSTASDERASFWCAAHVERGRLLLEWRAQARYRGGAAPSAEIRREAERDAGGLLEVDLESGAVAPVVSRDQALPQAQPAAVRRPPLASGDLGEPWLAGTKVARMIWEEGDGEQTLLLETRDRSTGAADTVVELARGTGLVARAALDGRHVFVHEEQRPTADRSWWVFSAQTGERIATLSFDAGSRCPVVLGERAYYLVERDEDGVRAPKLGARELASDRLAWELPLGQRRMARAPPLRQ
jgi:hypothetical protein